MNGLYRDQAGASHVAAVLVVVLVAVVGFAGYRVYSTGKQVNESATTQQSSPAPQGTVTKTEVKQADTALDKDLSQADAELDSSQLDADLDALL